ncbi:kinase-like domain-containing protein [Amylocarpus encephaloides]|uniref:Kinase-like domain-containing protein n=1 Tax=Amylocarpus encephaloides TaxID=45428 RepID=A0A9P7YB64_9HELO|nr:kinase-like domain-containing protein [Amylocarpus encephaloides]
MLPAAKRLLGVLYLYRAKEINVKMATIMTKTTGRRNMTIVTYMVPRVVSLVFAVLPKDELLNQGILRLLGTEVRRQIHLVHQMGQSIIIQTMSLRSRNLIHPPRVMGFKKNGQRRLRTLLLEARVRKNDSEMFVPADMVRNFLSKSNVLLELSRIFLKEASLRHGKQVARKIETDLKKIFAILVVIQKPQAILGFLEGNIDDGQLPFQVSRSDFDESEASLRCISRVFISWAKWELDEFRRVQCTILPFIGDDSSNRNGGFSTVYKIGVHPAHQKYVSTREAREAPLLAVKRFHSNNEKDFLAEIEMLKGISRMEQHPHLIKLLSTYKYRSQYHLMFPYADANLWNHWYDLKAPWLQPTTILWVLEQIQELAEALKTIHEVKPQRTHHLDETGIVAEDETQYGYHGDIKPENILWFRDVPLEKGLEKGDSLGILQITDFGLGRIHGRESRSCIVSRHVRWTPTYAAPEAVLSRPISRAYDVWSLGCVYLEFMTWFLMGPKGLEDFTKARAYDKGVGQLAAYTDSAFYELLRPENGMAPYARVKPSVTRWIEILGSQNRNSHESIRGFLLLIRDRILVVEPKQRTTAEKIALFLDTMLSIAETGRVGPWRLPCLLDGDQDLV